MDSERLADMLQMIREADLEIDSVLVVRNGHLVTDAYVHPFEAGQKHVIHSCTKSVVSALIGIAMDKGYLQGTDQLITDVFPERTIANLDADKKAMTIENILTMSTGLECRDSYLYRWRGIEEMRASSDWVQYVLDLPMVDPPGTQFEYCNGASFLLSAIVQETTGKAALAFAEEHLFGPLGIEDVDWPANPQGISIGWGRLRMRPHDMAKIGYLYLNRGQWDGEQIVPSDWIRVSTRKHIDGTLQDGYGYQWWVAENAYMALGYAGQYIIVAPEQNLVAVFTSELEERDFYVPQELFDEYILPACRSARPLPNNVDGLARLQASIDTLAKPQ
jgi:CubicO group peptidase (beta-lactamase class C family)